MAAARIWLFGNANARRMGEGMAVMKINNFRDMYIAELQELVSVETRLSDALMRMAGAAARCLTGVACV